MDTETLLKFMPPTISLLITSMFGLVVGVFIEKFKNRIRTIEYAIRTQKIIPPLSESLGSTLTIKLNEREINTLKVATVEVENKNSIDLENLVVNFNVGKNSSFQGNEAFIAHNSSSLFWTISYNDMFKQVLDEFNKYELNQVSGAKVPEELQRRIDYVLTNRDYFIPVLNRKNKAIFNFLIEDPIDGSEGSIFVSIVHKSVRFIKKSDDDKQKQRDLWIGIAIGIALASIGITILVSNNLDQKQLIILSAVIGFSYSFVGYIVLATYRKIKSIFK